MNHLGKKLLISTIAILALFSSGMSQDGNPLQFLNSVSQSAFHNPAVQNQTEKLVVGLPFISGVYFDWKSNFAMDYIFSRNFSYSFDKFYNKLGEPGDATGIINFPFIYLSLKKDRHNFSFSIRERMLAETYFDHEVLKFIDRGLAPYYEKDENFGPINFKNYYYRELALGYSNQIWDGLTIGIRPKLLFAHFYYDVQDLYLTVQTNPLKEQLLLIPNGSYKVSGPVDVTHIEEFAYTEIKPNPRPADYFFGFRNLSPALDFGITCKIEQGLEFAVSVIDLGYIGFKHKNYNIDFNQPITFNQENLYQSNDPGAPSYKEPKVALQELSDSIPYKISATLYTKTIKQEIPLKLNASIKHPVSTKTDIGLSGELKFFENRSEEYLTGFVQAQFNTKFELAGTLSLLNFDKILPGIGLSYTGRWVQFYMSTNNITAFVKPASAKYLNLHFGVNFLFSTTEK